MSIVGNMTGCYSPIGKTFIIADENGNEITGVVVDQERIFTATDNDVREGMVYASDSGVSTGNKNIPSYRTTKGRRLVSAGNSFSIPLSDYDQYDFTELQCIIAPFNTSVTDSVAADKVVLYNCVYPTGSTTKISDVTKNIGEKSIDLNIVNDSNNVYILHYVTYKEEE